MDYSDYRKILESEDEMDSTKRKQLLSEYLKSPSLPHLKSLRDLLGEMKSKLNSSEESKKRQLKSIQELHNKKRTS